QPPVTNHHQSPTTINHQPPSITNHHQSPTTPNYLSPMLALFNIDSQLSEEERAVRDSVRRFVDERVLPIIGKCYVDGRFPREIVPGLAHIDVFVANRPPE